MSDHQELSERELEILKLVATGVSNKEIAQRLYISTNTVKVHLKNIFAKIGAVSRTEAAMYAVKVGLVQGAIPVKEEIENNALQPVEIIPVKPNFFQNGLNWVLLVGFIVLLVVVGGTYAWQRSQALNATATTVIVPTPSPFPRWREKASMLTPRKSMAVVAYENQIYAMGGESETGILDVVERYDLVSDSWSKLSSMPVALTEINSVVIGGLIYIPGGKTPENKLSKTLLVYDPRHDQWDELAPLPTPLCGYALVAYEGRMYLFGGWDGDEAVDSVLEYNPVSDEWKQRKAMPTARAYAGAAVAGGKIFVMGGFDGEKGLDVNEEFFPDLDDEENEPWTVRVPLPEARYGMGVASMADIIYVVGGETESEENGGLIEYFHQQDAWQAGENPDRKETFVGIIPLGTYIYLLGGESYGGLSAHLSSYQAMFTVSIPFVNEQP